MTSALIVEGGVEFLVHMTSRLLRVAEGVGHAMDCTASLNLSCTAEGGYAARFMMLGGAFGTVLCNSCD